MKPLTDTPDAAQLMTTQVPVTADDIARAILITESFNDLLHSYIALKAFVLDHCEWSKDQEQLITACDSACYDVMRLKHPDVK